MMNAGSTFKENRQLARTNPVMNKTGVFILLLTLASLSVWIAFEQLSGHRSSEDITPEIVFVEPDSLQFEACRDGAPCMKTKGWYIPAERRIYLRSDWSADNFHDLGILLHELVHHVQTVGKLEYPCETEIELPAYILQEDFYRAHERDPDGYVPSAFTRFGRYSCIAQE